jgi:colanic acid/amylovoran biosynthesis glycosyltransferase
VVISLKKTNAMIKVAHVMYSYLGQSETFIWQYLHSFRDVMPIVIARRLENLDQFPVPNGQIRPINGPRWSISWTMDNWYRRVLKDPSGYTKHMIKKKDVKLIHAHFGPTGSSYLPLSISLNLPIITTFYGYDLSCINIIEQYRTAYTRLFKQGSLFLVEGPCMREKLISIGCPDEKILIQRIAIDINQYTFRTRSWDGKRKIQLLFVGRFVEKKGLEYALHALARIKDDYPFQFKIIGGGDLEESLRSLATSLGLKKEILWLGMQPHGKVIEEIKKCDILIQPSVTARDGDSEGGAPTIILEAQASGVPVIATTHADIPYVTCPNKSAFLSPERDVNQLADNICHLFDNSLAWAEIGIRGLKHVKEFHDVRTEVVTLEKIYKKFLHPITF